MKTVGVIGLGSIGLRHAKNLIAMGYEVYGCDPVAKIDGIEMLRDFEIWHNIDAAIICSPSNEHFSGLDNAVDFGIHVMVEKPIAISVGDIPYLLESAKSRDIVVAVGNNLRFHSCVKKAREWLDKKLIGEPIWARFTVSQLNKKPYKEDVVLNWGAHELDLARYLLGDAMVIGASGNHNLCDATLRHLGNDCQTTVHMDYLTEPEIRGFTIVGTKGYIYADLVERCAFLSVLELTYCDEDSWDENYIEEMQAFIDTIDGKPSPLLATGRDGLAALEMILKIKELAGIE